MKVRGSLYYSEGEPCDVGVYACRVRNGVIRHELGGSKTELCQDLFLLWSDGEWSYVGSGERYRGDVDMWLGPLPRTRIELEDDETSGCDQ